MKETLSILVIAAMVMMPFSALGGNCASCCEPAESDISVSEQDTCCSDTSDHAPADENERESDPCEGCNCPSRCCIAVSKVPVTCAEQVFRLAPVDHHYERFAHEDDALADPHLRLLKRPPRA